MAQWRHNMSMNSVMIDHGNISDFKPLPEPNPMYFQLDL